MVHFFPLVASGISKSGTGDFNCFVNATVTQESRKCLKLLAYSGRTGRILLKDRIRTTYLADGLSYALIGGFLERKVLRLLSGARQRGIYGIARFQSRHSLKAVCKINLNE